MNEYLCLLNEEEANKQIKRGRMKKIGNECAFLYLKREEIKIEFGVNMAKHYKLCSNQFFCEHKSLFIFQFAKKSCITCGKITDLLNDNDKCFECEITEMANKKAKEILDKEWAI